MPGVHSTQQPAAPAATVETLAIGPDRSRPSSSRRTAVVRALLVTVLLVGALVYLAAVSTSGGRFPRESHVGGVAVGGLDQAGAEAELRDQLGPVLDKPFEVRIETDTELVTTATAGLSIDYPASARVPARGSRFDPRQVWWARHGSYRAEPVIHVNEVRLAAFVDRLSRDYDHPPHNAALEYDGARAVAVWQGQDGVTVDRVAAARTLRAAYLEADRGPVTLPLRLTPAPVSLETARGRMDFAFQAISADVVVRVRGGGRLRLSPSTIQESLTFRPRGHRLVPHLDGDRLLRRAEVDGTVEVTGQELASAVLPVLTATGRGRTVTL